MIKRTPISRKLISVLLCLSLLMSFLPSFAVTAIDIDAVNNRTADISTWDEWKLLFGPDHPTTENAGAVWTDKSVFTADDLPKEYTDANGTLVDTGDNFLVALSAIASNKEIVGYSTIPTDTILVLDISGSMSSNNSTKDDEMVRAANQAIDDLLKLNNHNRVGVVLYNGTNANDGYSTPSEGSVVLLPLDRYTTTSTHSYRENNQNKSVAGYISLSNNNIGVYSGVKNSDGENNFNTRKAVSGATYIQSGLYRALEMFKSVEKSDTVIEDGVIQGGTKRMPITVLMSDGAPTVATSNYANVHSGNSDIGYGTDSGDRNSATPEVGFLTQLTAAYVKSEIEAWYETDSLFYSLGVGVGNSAVAKGVLDPANATDGSKAYWSSYFSLNDSTALRLTVPRSGTTSSQFRTQTVNIYRNAVITEENYIYTDKYFGANDAEGLALGFQDIVNEIYIQSRYYPTSLEGGSPDFSGYISFEDKIGEYMEVKDIKGILLNGNLYTGKMLTEKIGTQLGTIENPSELGIEFLNAVKTRLGITDNTEVYKLIRNAWDDGQLHYDEDTGEFSNYIGWYAYADGSYAGYYNEGTTTAPEGAVYANKSYGLLGEASGSIKDSDMMYMSIQVHTNIDTGEQWLIWKVPAALVPMVTYEVTVEGNVINDNTNVTDVNIVEATPVRLLYEVGLHPDINELNVGHIVDEKHIDENGNRVFWSNYFDITAESHDDHIVTHADFTPNEDNERYYYVDIAPLYAADGAEEPISSAPVAGTTYYTKQYTYSSNSDKPIVYYEAVAADDITAAVYNETLECYVIPGHIYNHPNVDSYFKKKADTTITDSAEMYYYPEVVATNASYTVSTHHGNNGKLTVTPAQGIAISKTLDEVEVGASQDFKFRITLSAPEGASLAGEYDYVLAAIGETTGTEGKVQVNNGVIEIDLAADQTIYITDIPTGTVYTVEEISDNSDYMVKNVHVNGVAQTTAVAAGTVTQYTIDDVDFLNTPTSEGELVIKKEVTHPFVSDPEALANKLFTVKVTLSGGDVANKTFTLTRATGDTTVTTDANGEFTVTLTAGEAVSIKGIPAETDYTVSEPAATMPSGFELDSASSSNLTGSISADSNIVATIVNDYNYTSVTSDVDVVITKELVGRDWLDSDSFEFEVVRYDSLARASEVKLYSVELIKGKQTDTYQLNETYTAEGTYYYIIRELAGADDIGITYDTVIREFRVFVTDEDMDGRLEISKVENVLRTGVTGDAETGFTVTADDFVNNYAATGGTAVTIEVNKDINGGEFQLNGFKFGLYSYATDDSGNPTDELELVTESTLTDINGDASINLAFSAASVGKTFTYILKEIDTGVSGMTYDATAYEVTIKVIDDLDGTISTDVSYAKIVSDTEKTAVNDIEFVNTYTPANGELILSGKKVLENRVQFADEFKFELYEADSDAYDITGKTPIDEAYNTYDGSFAFDLLTYTAEGTHYYVVKEVNTGVAGVTYDDTVYKIEVRVEQQGDAYVSEIVSMNGNEIVFTNTYSAKPTEVVLSGNKILSGRDINEGEFEFALYETDSDFAVDGAAVQTKSNVANTFTFEKIEYAAAGTYYYVVEELNNGLGGITYDSGEYHITVVITDNGRGQLVSTVTMTKDGQDVTGMVFRNGYTAAPTTIDIDGKKNLSGRDMNAGEFEFKLVNALNNQTIATVYNDANGNFKFEDIPVNSAGTHHAIITETVTDISGVTYDTTIYGFIVEIEDDLNGNLTETARRVWRTEEQLSDPYAPIEFNNSYKAANEVVSLGGTKTLDGRTLNEGEFKFNLYETDATYSLVNAALVETVKNGDGGKFNFSDILIDSDEERYYVIVEDATDKLGGVKYDENVYNVKIDVTDDLNGKYIIETTVTVGNKSVGVDEIVFNNTYKAADTTVAFDGTKTIDGRTLNEGEFKFNLYKTDSTYSLTNATLVEQVVNGEGGKFTFKPYDIKSDDDLYFVIVEDATDKLGGVKYDESVYKIKVEVTDLLNGEYDVKTTVTLGVETVDTGVVFNNTYKAADTTVTFDGTKTIDGRTLNEGEFKFNLYKTDSTYSLTNATLVEQVVNGEDGKFTFKPYDIKSDDDMYFVIVEDATDKAEGVEYDTTVYKILVDVTDDGNGNYTVETVITSGDENKEDVVFVNVFTPKDVTVDINVQKVLENKSERKMGLDGFDFTLVGEGKTLNAKTDAEGKAGFKLTFTAEDIGKTFTYKLSEVKGNVKGMIYSEEVVTVTLTVSVNADGVIEVIYNDDPVPVSTVTSEFTNIYEGDPDIPVTGETTNNLLWFLFLIAGAIGLVVTFILGKKNKHAEE